MGIFTQTETPKNVVVNDFAPPTQKSIYDRVSSDDTGGSHLKIEPGIYPLLYVDCLKIITDRRGDQVAVAEFFVLASEVPNRPAGMSACWTCNFRYDASPRNIKSFLMAVGDVSTSEITSEAVRFAFSSANPVRGRLVRCEAAEKETVVNKNLIVVCTWRSVPEEVQKRSEELKAALLTAAY